MVYEPSCSAGLLIDMNTRIITIACLLGLTMPQLQAASDTEQRLQRLERRVSHITDLTLEVEGLKRENRRLQGSVEELQHTIDNLQRKQRELYLDVDDRLNRMLPGAPAAVPTPAMPGADAAQSVVPPKPARPVPTTPPVSTVPPGDPAKEEAAYAAAYDLLRPEQRRYQEAIQAFELFIQQYPNGKFTDNARYWLGEANYVTQNNKAAQVAFLEVLEYHPQSPKVPGALLKIGYIEDAQGDEAAARANFQRVIDDYPTSSAAGMAKKRLLNMQRKAN
jgi:tol-pal system protein YbgF